MRTAQVAVMKASEERIKAVDEEKLKLIEVSLAPLLHIPRGSAQYAETERHGSRSVAQRCCGHRSCIRLSIGSLPADLW